MAFRKPTYNFMLLGKTGNGKSSTGNTLINRRNVFQASNKMKSCTQIPQVECGSFENYTIKVVDTPGLMDTKVDMDVTLDIIGNAMALLPDGFDALLLVMKYGDRCTDEVVKVISAIRETFGKVFAKEYCIIVMTHGDNFDTDMDDEEHPVTFYDYCKKIREPPELLSLLTDCDYRVVLFYNKTKGKREETIDTLLQLVQNMKHRSQRYDSDIFAKCATERNKYVISLKLPQLLPSIQEKLSFLKEELEKAIEDPDPKSELAIKMKAQQLLDTIEVESGGTSLMDDLKTDVRRITSTLEALTAQREKRKENEEQRKNQEQKEKQERKEKEKYQQTLHELKKSVEMIKNTPSRTSGFLSGIVAGIFGVAGVAFTAAAAVVNPICVIPAIVSFATASSV